jgi:nitroreductase
METLQAIKLRKSVRAFTDAPIPDGQLAQIVAAANESPVGMGQFEAVGLVVVRDRAVLDRISAAATDGTAREGDDIFYGAPTVILITAARQAAEPIAFLNAGVFAENILLAATDLGLGSVLIFGSVAAFTGTPDLLGADAIPESHRVVASVALGYATDQAAAGPKKPREVRVAYV